MHARRPGYVTVSSLTTSDDELDNTACGCAVQVKTLLALLSIFNFNLEIVAPECTIPNVGFVDKWYAEQMQRQYINGSRPPRLL